MSERCIKWFVDCTQNFSNSTFPKQLHVYEQSGLIFLPVLHLWMFSQFFICHIIFCSPQIIPLSENTWQCTTEFTGMLSKTLFIDKWIIKSLKTHTHHWTCAHRSKPFCLRDVAVRKCLKIPIFQLDLPHSPHFAHRILKTRKSA